MKLKKLFHSFIFTKNSIAFSPWKVSLFLTSAYLLFFLCYIWGSSSLAAKFSNSTLELEKMEIIKGTLSVFFTAMMLLIFSKITLSTVQEQAEKILSDQKTIMMLEQRAIAGVMASSIAHDIKNLLGVALWSLEAIQEDQEEGIEVLQKTVDGIEKLSQRLMNTASKGMEYELSQIDLVEVTKEAFQLAQSHKTVSFCSTQIETPEVPVHIKGNSELIRGMLFNLILNSAESMPSQEKIKVVLQIERNMALIEVHDSGPGIPKDKKDEIFTPFYTTKKKGNGLGLMAAKACASFHQGFIVVSNSPLGGACFTIKIPLEMMEEII